MRTERPSAPAGRIDSVDLPVHGDGGHAWRLLARVPERPSQTLLWLPALGVAARHYLAFADALAARGVAVFLHEWRGHGSSSLRAGRRCDWGYRELLRLDLPRSEAMVAGRVPGLPRTLGGHSLGGQLACCRLALAPDSATRLWLVASGAPWWRAFPARTRWWLPLAYRFLPWLADLRGALPGHAVGFGGNEARGLVRDWARTGLSGRYAARGLDVDLDAALRGAAPDVRAVWFADDWLGPPTSLRFLLDKLGSTDPTHIRLDRARLGVPADHFAWMKRPDAVADVLADKSRDMSAIAR